MTKNKTSLLEDNKLWRAAMEIATGTYGVLNSLPEEEQWGIRSKLRQRAFEITSEIAEAVGAIDPRDQKYSFGLARRSLFGLKNAYILAHKTGVFSVEPEMMVSINKLSALLDLEIAEATTAIPRYMEQFSPGDKK